MADAKKGIPAIGGAAAVIANVTGQKKKNQGRRRMLDGKPVQPVLFDGRAGGHGKYFTGRISSGNKDGSVWDEIIKDENEVPLPLNQIGGIE